MVRISRKKRLPVVSGAKSQGRGVTQMSIDHGWTVGDLDGELMERGIRFEDLPPGVVDRFLDYSRVRDAADAIERETNR